jgi:SNF2 family DNA or RNA helicase
MSSDNMLISSLSDNSDDDQTDLDTDMFRGESEVIRSLDSIGDLFRGVQLPSKPAPILGVKPVSRNLLENSDDPQKLVENHFEAAFQAFRAGIDKPNPTRLSCHWVPESPPGFRTIETDGHVPKKLRPHQCEGVGHMLSMLKGGYPGLCLADEMGLGKTIQTITFLTKAKAKHGHGTALLVVPDHLLDQWVDELEDLLNEGVLTHLIYRGPGRFKGHGDNKERLGQIDLKKYNIVITTYDTLRGEWKLQHEYAIQRYCAYYPEEREKYNITSEKVPLPGYWPLVAADFKYCILDEGHKVRNITSLTAKAAAGVKAQFRICITGTRLQNRFRDVGGILYFLWIEPWCDWDFYQEVLLMIPRTCN